MSGDVSETRSNVLLSGDVVFLIDRVLWEAGPSEYTG